MMSNLSSWDDVHAFLLQLQAGGIRRDLEPTRVVLQKLGSPHLHGKVVHVAGTNGKGSTCRFVAQMIAQQGCRVGLLMSPHVVDYTERISVFKDQSAHVSITHSQIVEWVNRVIHELGGDPQLTYFEWNVVLGFLHFQSEGVDWVVLETGMGGRWDATNVCVPRVTGITTIGYDHMEYLGNTLGAIVTEKLQIVKPGAPLLFGPKEPALVQLAEQRCADVQTVCHTINDFASCHESRMAPVIASASEGQLAISGYLRDNLHFALTLFLVIAQNEPAFSLAKIDGAALTVPPARCQILATHPDVILDGAHNEHGLRALKLLVTERYGDHYDLVFGCLANRPFLELAQLIHSPHDNYWIRFDGGLHTTPESVYQQVQQRLGGSTITLHDGELERLMTQRRRPLLICGSLYLCGQVLDLLHNYIEFVPSPLEGEGSEGG